MNWLQRTFYKRLGSRFVGERARWWEPTKPGIYAGRTIRSEDNFQLLHVVRVRKGRPWVKVSPTLECPWVCVEDYEWIKPKESPWPTISRWAVLTWYIFVFAVMLYLIHTGE